MKSNNILECEKPRENYWEMYRSFYGESGMLWKFHLWLKKLNKSKGKNNK